MAFDRFQRLIGGADDHVGEFLRLAADGLDDCAALAVDHLRQTFGLVAQPFRDRIDPAGQASAEHVGRCRYSPRDIVCKRPQL